MSDKKPGPVWVCRWCGKSFKKSQGLALTPVARN